ncbi:MAG TPA: hypothetical protein PKM58_05755, partial [Pyrinomonadaceae bacterium]|nr:hypothetical protein [Pyrinomonadaceae bacterium]
SVKLALKHINQCETTVAEIAVDNGYDYVVCGHIHEPVIKEFENRKGSVTYLNSGDWIENLTSLEYLEGEWSVYRFDRAELAERDLADTIEIGGTLEIAALAARII